MFVLMHLGEIGPGGLFYYLCIFHTRSMCIFLVFAHDIVRYGLTTFHTRRKNQVKVAGCKGKSTLQSTTLLLYARTAQGAQWASAYQTLRTCKASGNVVYLSES
jgi:hypothetical protein